MPHLRVATYNIRLGGRGGGDLDTVVSALDTDVLLVNESPKAPLLWRSRCRRLAERWGLEYVAGGRPAGSNLVLVAAGVRVRGAGSERVPQPLFAPRRGVAWAQLEVAGRPLGVVSCHLGLDRRRRRAEVEHVLAVAGRLRGPTVLGGDLNEPPTGPSWRRLRRAGFLDPGTDAWPTFPAADPERRIDALLLRGPVRAERHGAPAATPGQGAGAAVAGDAALLSRASDHRPVVADLRWT